MKAKLFCKTGLLAGSRHEIFDEATIGKDPGNHVVIDTKIISSRHARIFFDEKAKSYFLEDLRSRNGTRLDGIRVRETEKLSDLHVITFAEKFDFIFQMIDGVFQEKAPAAPRSSPAQRADSETKVDRRGAIPPMKEKAPAAPLSSTQPLDGETRVDRRGGAIPPMKEKAPAAAEAKGGETIVGRPRPATLPNFQPAEEEPKTIVGRPVIPPTQFAGAEKKSTGTEARTLSGVPPLAAPDFQPENISRSAAPAARFFLEMKRPGKEMEALPLKEGENIIGRAPDCSIIIEDASISRQHAAITVRAGKVTVKDLGSKNRTFLGNREVTAEVEIKLDTKLKFGAVEAQLIYTLN